jgi:pyrroline-5-carboxylate reductase
MKIGFIGSGNMARAIIGGLIKSEVAAPVDILASAPSEATRQTVAQQFGIGVTADNTEVARTADVVVLAVKPGVLGGVIDQIRSVVAERGDAAPLVISIAAGKTIAWIEGGFDCPVRLVRVMPNTPALVGEGVSALCPNDRATEADVEAATRLFGACGLAQVMSEQLVDVCGAVAGASPAYVFMFIEALADAAVAEGMPRAQAYPIVSQAVLGSAKMVLETGRHPGELKDMVCSPAGTTIEGLQVLEEGGMRASVMRAIRAVMAKTRQL